MDVVSTLLPPAGGVVLLVMDTLAHGKNLVTTMVVGDLREDRMSTTGSQCIARLADHHARLYPDGNVYMVEVRIPDHVHERVGEVLRTASDGDAVVFVCHDSALYDAVFPLLGLKHSSYSPH